MDDHDPSGLTPPFGTPAHDRGSGTLPDHVQREILSYVREALGRFAIVESPFLEDGIVHLRLTSAETRTPLGTWANNWSRMPDSERRVRAAQIATALAQPVRLSQAPRVNARWDFTPIIVTALVLTLAYLGWKTMTADGKDDAARANTVDRRAEHSSVDGDVLIDKDDATTGLQDREARSIRVCEATRARVVRGATVTVADADGWVVEYLAFKEGSRDPLHTHPNLSAFVENPSNPQGSEYIWSEEASLTEVGTSDDHVLVADATITGRGGDSLPGVRVTFSGALADAYFRDEQRRRYFHVASALSDELEVTHAALYARCATSNTNHIGSWYRGSGTGEAVTALIYAMGTYADPLHLAPPFYRPIGEKGIDRSLAFASIKRVANEIDRPLLATLMGREDGVVLGGKTDAVVLSFPFRDGNRASRLSREIARLTNIGGN